MQVTFECYELGTSFTIGTDMYSVTELKDGSHCWEFVLTKPIDYHAGQFMYVAVIPTPKEEHFVSGYLEYDAESLLISITEVE